METMSNSRLTDSWEFTEIRSRPSLPGCLRLYGPSDPKADSYSATAGAHSDHLHLVYLPSNPKAVSLRFSNALLFPPGRKLIQ